MYFYGAFDNTFYTNDNFRKHILEWSEWRIGIAQ